jgi:hypothetical protein
MNELNIPMSVTVSDQDYSLQVSGGQAVGLAVDTAITAPLMEHYLGPYTVTPGSAPVTLDTIGKVMDQNIIVNPVPGNYGQIIWDGSVLNVR